MTATAKRKPKPRPKPSAARAGGTDPNQWTICAGSKVLHYYHAGTPLCGRALTPEAAFVANSTPGRPLCAECDRIHTAKWLTGGGFPV